MSTLGTASSLFAHHGRDWLNNRYVYPVISRRSHGLSIGNAVRQLDLPVETFNAPG